MYPRADSTAGGRELVEMDPMPPSLASASWPEDEQRRIDRPCL
jgi:hypothetical protein